MAQRGDLYNDPYAEAVSTQFVSSAVDSEYASVKIQEASPWSTIGNGMAEAEARRSFWNKVKFAVWALAAAAVIAAIIGLSVTMAVVKDKDETTSGAGTGTVPPTPPTPPGISPSPIPSPKPGSSPKPGATSPPPPPPADDNGQLTPMMNPPFKPTAGWTPLWWDEFEGSSLDPRWWNTDLGYGQSQGLWAWGNKEEQYYTDAPENVRLENGQLLVTALRQDTKLDDGYTFKYTSGRINTKGKLGVYGGMTTTDGRKWGTIRIEASLKAPQPTQGLWAAYWMLPVDLRYGAWASSGELDIYEMKNEFDHVNIAIHYGGPSPKYNERTGDYPLRPGKGSFADSFATAVLEWTPTTMTFLIDDEVMFVGKSKSIDPNGWYSLSQSASAGPNSPFDIPYYFVINLAVGGKYPGNTTASSIFPNTFSIDYVRIYGKP